MAILDGATVTTAELNYLDITTLGTVQASKAVTADASGDVKWGDSDKATFGDSDDLQIYHDSHNSYITDEGAGTLRIRSSNQLVLQVSDGAGGWENALLADDNGAVTLRHNNSNKLATTSTGIDVTGRTTLTGTDGTADAALYLTNSTPTTGKNYSISSGNAGEFMVYDRTSSAYRMVIDSSGNVGIGTDDPDGKLHVYAGSAGSLTANGNADDLVVENSTNAGLSILTPDADHGYIIFGSASDNEGAIVRYNQSGALMTIGTELSGGELAFRTGSGTERMRIDSSGYVGIGTSSPSADYGSDTVIEVSGATSPGFVINDTGQASKYGFHADSTKCKITYGSNTLLSIDGAATGAMTIDSSGNVEVSTGNLVIGTSGKGIDFSATSDGSGTMTSELLDDYEEGTFTPVISGSSNAGSWSGGGSHTGTYRKVGTLVYITVQVNGTVTASGSGNLQITGLPYTSASATGGHGQALALGALYNWDIGNTAYQIGCRVNDNSTTIAFWNNIDNAADASLGWPFGSSGVKFGTISGCYVST